MRWAVLGVAVLCLALAGCAEAPAPAPSVAPVKDPGSLSSPEVNELLADCVRSKGWDPIVGRTSILPNVPPEQNDAFQRDYDACYSELGFDQVKAPEYTPEYLAKKYGQEQATRACLVEQGQEVPESPSLQAYTDMFFSGGTVYSSYDSLPPNQAATDALRKICGDPLETWGTDVDR